jgi:Ca-activated chloride channel family protein
VPEGPVHDALEAVSEGEAADAKAADWPALRAELEALLSRPPQPPQNQNQPPENQENQDSQKNPGEGGQGKSGEDQKEKSGQEPQSSNEPSSADQGKEGEEDTPPPPQAGQSAFGEMPEQNPPPPPPSGESQKIGGQPERTNEAAERPELAIPLQKLEQLRNQDSPARLHQLMQDQKGKPAEKGRDW